MQMSHAPPLNTEFALATRCKCHFLCRSDKEKVHLLQGLLHPGLGGLVLGIIGRGEHWEELRVCEYEEVYLA